MNDTAKPRARLRSPTPASVTGAVVLLSIAAKSLSERLSDPDLWWHLRAGRLIVETRAIPATDPFSFTAPGKRWVAQEWGSEVLMDVVRTIGGLRGIVVWRALMLVLIYALAARLVVRAAGNTVAAWGIVALSAYAGAQSWTERPNLFSFALFVVTLMLLARRDRRIWWFVPMALVWANLHGMVLLGIGTVGVVAASEGIKVALRWEGADSTWARRLGGVTAAGLIASFLNPYGPGLHAHAFRLIRVVRDIVQEWAAPDFREVPQLLFLALVLLVVAALALAPSRPDPSDVALALAFVALGLTAVRNVTPAAIVLGIVLARTAPGAVERALAPRRRAGARPRTERPPAPLVPAAALAVATAALTVLVVARFPSSGAIEEVIADTYPVALIRSIPDGARVFAKDDWGGLTTFLRWPQVRVAFDGRSDFYGEELVRNYRRTIAARPGWQERLRSICATHVLVDSDDAGLADAIAGDPGWTPAGEQARWYDDSRAQLYAIARSLAGC